MSESRFLVGRLLAQHVKAGLLDRDWLNVSTFDLGDKDEILSALPDDLVLGGDELPYLSNERIVIISHSLNEHGESLDLITFFNKCERGFITATCFLDKAGNALRHPSEASFSSDIAAVQGLQEQSKSTAFLTLRDIEVAEELQRLGEGDAVLLNFLFQADFARTVVEKIERRSLVGRKQGLPPYEIVRKRVPIDWMKIYSLNPKCRQDMPSSALARGVPLHPVVQHWCERQSSGVRGCDHFWEYVDEQHRECVLCGRYSWFRHRHFRGDERYGRVVHDYERDPA